MSGTARRADEELLSSVFAEALGCPQVGRDDDVFVLGGTAPPARRQLAVRLAALLRERLGLEVPLAAVLARPTVAGLAAWIGASRPAAVVPPIERAASHRELPLSYGQQRLWFLDLLEPGSMAFNIALALELAGALDASFLEASLHTIEQRHEALRARFAARDGQPFQWVAPCERAALPVIDLSALPPERRTGLVARLTEAESRQPFDLKNGPLWRFRLLRLDGAAHRLVLALHHIACDGWSIEVLLREIGACYTALAGGAAPALPALPIQYGDYALWQRRHFDRDALAGPLAAWTRRLAGHTPVLDLAIDRTPPAVRSAAGASLSIQLPTSLLEAAREHSRRQGATLFMTLLAVFEALLARYTGRRELLVGTPVANRPRTELQGLIGFFVNTLVLPATVAPAASFRALLAQVREVSVAALSHQDLPLEMLVQELAPDRGLSGQPLLQAAFTYHNAPTVLPAMPGLALRLVEVDGAAIRFDLNLAGLEARGGLRVLLEYSTELFSRAAAGRLLGHFASLLDSALADPERAIEGLPLLTGAERHQLLAEWNDTAVPRTRGLLLHHLFEAQAARTPAAPAATFAGETLTYAGLDARADRLARRLRGLGCGPETRVGVALERTLNLIVALLGVLKTGAAYVPLDPDYPRERLAFVLENAAPRVLITETHLLSGLPPAPGEVLCLDAEPADGGPIDRDDGAIDRDGGAPSAGDDRQLVYVLYTSGSTGRPKGVGVPHGALINFLDSMRRAPGFAPGERLLAVASLAFDIAALDIFLPLTTGGCVELATRAEALDAVLLAARLRASGASVLQATPATWRMLLDAGWTGDPGLRALCGGEALPRDLAAVLAGRVGELWNLYGPTETTVWASAERIRADETGAVSIGRPGAAVRFHLLDRELQAVPLGLPGEIWIGGAGMTRGYVGRPDLTAERFLPDPFAADLGEPGGRLYQTGDLARLLPDGRLEHLGRLDHQVKIRGFRIELGEIEVTLASLAGVRQAVVVAREGRLVAYVVGDAPAESLRRSLRERLPDYMVPAAFVALGALPMTPNSKVDRKALPAPEWQGAETHHVAPRTPAEEVLAGIWAELLGLERVGAADDFFDLGGHSLLATRLVAAVRDAFQVDLPLRLVFERPTVEGLARAISDAGEAGAPVDDPVAALPREPGENRFPVSFSQLREWILDRLEPGNPAYNIPSPLRIEGPLAVPVLTGALQELVRRHEVFRTRFAAGDEEQEPEPLQIVLPEGRLEVPVIDLSALPDSARGGELRRQAHDEAATGFDLATAPLLRTRIVRLAPEEHALLLTVHHIIADGWSMGILHREVAALYEAAAGSSSSSLGSLPLQYADYAVWQRRRLAGETLERQESFWRQRLSGAPPLLELPTDRPRPPVRSSRGGKVPFFLPQPLAGHLERLARQRGVTLFMVLLAGYQTLLGRWSGQDDVVVGTYSGNRPRRELEGLIGFFINTLALRTHLKGNAGDPSFAALLGRVREATLGAYAHADIPFEKLLDLLQLPRDPSRTPLFQALLVLQSFPAIRAGLSTGVRLSGLPVESEKADYDLELWLREGPDGVAGTLQYSTDLFDEATMTRFATQLRTLLEAAVADPEQNIWTLPLITEDEQALQLQAWSRGPAVPAGQALLHRLVEEQAARTPGAVALEAGTVRLTCAELVEQAGRLAHRLREDGIGTGSIVALAAERTPELIVSMLAVLQSGAAYLPLDPAYPQERREYMLADSGAVALENSKDSKDSKDFKDFKDGNDSAAYPEDLAYVIYTSGSTGLPKGVAVPHRAIASFVRAARETYGLAPGDRVLQFASISFDTSAEEIWPALASGATLVLRSEDMAASIPHFLREVERLGITVLDLPTAFWHELATGMEAENLELPRAVRLVILGGEEALADRLALWRRRAGSSVRLVNTYGPTETTIVATRRELADLPPGGPPSGTIPIGRPIPGARACVLDRFLAVVPPGVRGELWIGGAGVARGYLGRPGLTAERFVPDPFADDPGARLYRTGDLAVLRPDGDLVFAGRADRQLKIRGFRIEPGEIEQALLGLAGVREAVVVAREDRLVAYVAGEVTADALWRSFRDQLRERLPEHMVPAAFVRLAALPLTPNGKVDRRALPAPEWQRTESYLAPRTPVEEVLAGIWAELLGLERVGVADDFFALGGHSLLATRVTSRLRSAFGVEIPLRALFEAPVLADLATRIEAALRAGAVHRAPPLVPASTRGEVPLPLSFAQQRLWFLAQLEPGSPFYNMPVALRIAGPLHPEVLALCLGETVRRHEALRTVFAAPEGAPVQVIQPAAPFGLPVVDLSGRPETEREALALTLAGEEAGRPFDLTCGPLLRGVLLRLAEGDHVAALTVHHIASDGWSLGVLVRELGALYPAFSAGRPSPLAELPVQYADFAVWQRQWLQGEVLSDQLAYWRGHLAGAPPVLELPTDRPRPALQSLRGGRVFFEVGAELSGQIEALSRQLGVTAFMTLLGAFAAVLSRYSGQSDVVIGTPIAGRNHVEVEDLIGFFAGTLVLRTLLDGDPSFRALACQVREAALGAYTHQDLPFEKLVDELRPERNLSHAPVFQVMFGLENVPFTQLEIPGLTLASLPVDGGRVPFDLDLALVPSGRGFSGRLDHNLDLFDTATAERIAGHFRTLLATAVESAGTAVSSLSLLTAEERHAILLDANDTAVEVAGGALHELVEAVAARSPDAVAVACEERSLTYGALNAAANRLARHLRRRRVGPEVLVGLFVERSLDMLVGLLGVLKAGGAWVPLDPTYPAERLAWVVADSGLPVLLTQRSLAASLPRHAATVVELDAGITFAGESGEDLPPLAGPDNRAYVIYTSGSTGRPKGVEVRHRGVVNVLASMARRPGLGAGDVLVAVTTISFDIAVLELFLPLLAGARIELVDRETAADGVRLAERIAACGATVMQATPATWRVLLEAEWEGMPGLKVLCGGEALPPDLAARLLARAGELWNVYGPTETTVWSAVHPVGGDGRRPIPIGSPIANTVIHLLDRHLEPVLPGAGGELYIGGEGLARGYLGLPDLTAERFVPDPFGDLRGAPGSRLYRTGDLARRLSGGALDYLGRVDHQVKVRGFRIELGEIEAVLAALPGVRECAAVVREDVPGTRRLAAYVVPDVEMPEAAVLRFGLQERLPDYMVPVLFVALDALPLTPNGKVDRRALVRMAAPEGAATAAAYVAPRDRAEEILAEVWADVLKLARVGIHDNFFSLGGDSILTIQMVARCKARGVHLVPRQIFQHQTIAELSPGVDASALREPGGPVPWTPAQIRLLAGATEPESWNDAVLIDLPEGIGPETVERALGELVGRHEALRLRFARAVDGAWSQRVASGRTLLLQRIEEAGIEELRDGFDGTAGPLAAALVSAGPERPGRLLLVCHPLAVDGLSWRVLLDELAVACDRLHRGEPVDLPPAVSFRRWTEALPDPSPGPASALPAPAVPLPRDLRDAGAGNNGEPARTLRVELEAEATRALLDEVPKRYGNTAEEVLLAALAETLSGWTGARRMTVDRDARLRGAEIEGAHTIGCLATALPVHLEGHGAPGDLLKSGKERLRRPLAEEAVRPLPVPEVGFRWSEGPLVWHAEPLAARRAPGVHRRHLLEVDASLSGGRISVAWTYSERIHRPDTVRALADRFLENLRSLIAHCRSPEAGGFTPSDFPESRLSQEALDDILAELS